MKNQIKLDEQGLIGIYDIENKNSLYFVDEVNNRKIMDFFKEKNNSEVYSMEETITAYSVSKLNRKTVNNCTHEINFDVQVQIPIYRVEYSFGIM